VPTWQLPDLIGRRVEDDCCGAPTVECCAAASNWPHLPPPPCLPTSPPSPCAMFKRLKARVEETAAADSAAASPTLSTAASPAATKQAELSSAPTPASSPAAASVHGSTEPSPAASKTSTPTVSNANLAALSGLVDVTPNLPNVRLLRWSSQGNNIVVPLCQRTPTCGPRPYQPSTHCRIYACTLDVTACRRQRAGLVDC